jgi:signal transduction histidine kinase
MGVLRRNRWFALAGAITLVFAGASAALPRGYPVIALSDVTYFFLLIATSVSLMWNARNASGTVRVFWSLMAAGNLLWSANAGAWVYYEVVRRWPVPDPWFMDVLLFSHLIPVIAAVRLRPDRIEAGHRSRVGTLDFFLLLAWWIFLYAFVVFPSQYVTVDVAAYDRNFGALYLVQSGFLVLVLGFVARGAIQPWRRVYVNFMGAGLVYAVASQALNMAVSAGNYYTGSLYDVPLIGCMGWMAATSLSVQEWRVNEVERPEIDGRWSASSVRLAMMAILSLPVLGFWEFLWDHAPENIRTFRLLTVLAAMLVLGVFMFLRQYMQDQTLIRLLEDSRQSFEKEQRLQSHLVQREKLASLGQLVAGAAQEIDQPLNEIAATSEQLWSKERLTSEQDSFLRKIVHHSQRTRELIANLLSFAQQSSGEKRMLDLCTLLQRSVHMRDLQRPDQKIRIETAFEANLPQVWGDGHQLFQAFAQIAENSIDALEEAGGGVLRVSAQLEGNEVLVRFSDTGPGIREPHRVFDPFYTTKPVGKGTGLGLSAVYGVVQNHQGQISCQNDPGGGATFLLRLPIAPASGDQALAAASS